MNCCLPQFYLKTKEMSKKQMNSWTQIRIACDIKDLETVCSIMSMLDSGLMIEDANEIDRLDTCYGELIDEAMKTADRTRGAVSIFVPEEKNPSDYTAFFKERLAAVGVEYDITLSGMKEEDWADSWKQYYKPVRIGKRLIVVPSWEEYTEEAGDIVLRMDPGMAFGTGTHETTRLCSMLLEDFMEKDSYVLDIGTGSGILAIAAAKLGAGAVNAYDIDPVAVRVARENCKENGCHGISIGISDLLAGVDISKGGYDFICANIVADIILRMAKDIARYLKIGGLLAVSGIIEPQAESVKNALEAGGLTHVLTRSENDWNAMLFTRKA